MAKQELEAGKRTQIEDPTPQRRKRIMEKLLAFIEERISIADLKGIRKDQMDTLSEMGYIKLKHGRVDEADIIFKGLTILDHRNAYYHACMGAVHQKKERPVEAIMEYSIAINLNRRDMSSRVNRGEIYLRHKNYKKAAEDFRAAILLDSTGSDLWANRARSLVIALKAS